MGNALVNADCGSRIGLDPPMNGIKTAPSVTVAASLEARLQLLLAGQLDNGQ
jgi:hypothetical protein